MSYKMQNDKIQDNLFERIKAFALKMAYVDDIEYTRKTKIEDDLGVTGDDAVDFILAFGKEFNVDVSTFSMGKYFGPEGFDFLGQYPGPEDRNSLTLGSLEKAVKQGKLDDNIINTS